MDCRHCGANVEGGAQFCGHCGVSTASETDVRPVGAEPASPPVAAPAGRLPSWIPVVGGVLVVALAAWYLFRPEPAPPSRSDLATLVITPMAPIEPGQPSLGRPVGLSLLIGNARTLRRLDLDDGSWTEYETIGWPLLVSGDWLVLSDGPNGGSIGGAHAVLVDDPDAGPRSFDEATFGRPGLGPEPGEVWLLVRSSPELLEWRLIDLESGYVERVVATSLEAVTGLQTVVGPEVVTSPADGVFTLDGQSYHKVFDGRLLASSNDYVLTEACSQPIECTLHWLDRSTGEEVDRPLPPASVDRVDLLSADGQLLAFVDVNLGPLVFDVERDRFIETGAIVADELIVSPDGRFLAIGLTGGLAVIDLETGEEHRVIVPGGFNFRAVFVEN